MVTDNPEVTAFLAAFDEDLRALALSARTVVLSVLGEPVEMVDRPARLIGYGTDTSYKGLICGIALQRKYINLMFARGAELPDPAGMLEGTGKRARHVKLRGLEDVDRPEVRRLLEAAVALHQRLNA